MRYPLIQKICILCSVTLLLTACGVSGEENGTSVSASEQVGASDAQEGTVIAYASESSEETEPTPAPEGEIIVANIRSTDSYLSERVITFSRENPVYGIQYQEAWQEDEAERVLMETVNGKGPDILYLNRQDMESLQSNEVLGDLRQLISPDTYEVLLPGVIEMGTYEEEFVAVPMAVAVRTLVTSRDYWEEDSWTMEDILSILQEHRELRGLFVDMTGQDEYYYNMYDLLGRDIRNSSFIRDGSCSFDSEEFRNLLTLVKDMTQKAENNSTPANRLAPLTEGEYLGVEYYLYDMEVLCKIYETMGESTNLVGYPSGSGSHHYLSDYGMLVVNRTSMEKSGVKELVNDLLSLESQQMLPYEISVRLDIPESQVAYSETGNLYYWKSPNYKGFSMAAKEDGSSYLEEYMEILESAVPMSVDTDELFNMVMEEADGYFQGSKTLDTVADIIQSRVQLYLDEKK